MKIHQTLTAKLSVLFACLSILLLSLPITVFAASNDNNVETPGTGHAPGNTVCGDVNFPYRNPTDPGNGQAALIRARVYKGDVTGIVVWYTTKYDASVQSDWSSVSMAWEANWFNCGGSGDMDIWKATIPAQLVQVWYKIAYTDGSNTRWQRDSGEAGNGVYNTDGGWDTPSTTLYYGSGILGVTLSSFDAVQQGNAVQVTWETATEQSNRGFNLYRSATPDAPAQQLNSTLIPSQAQGSMNGFVYTWTDSDGLVDGQTVYYWVEDVDMNGAATLHGPVSVTYVAPTAVTLSQLRARAGSGNVALWVLPAALLAVGGLAVWRRRSASLR